ncbi:MAG TPA: sigma-70 family RNA polymerase sigma factor [Phycisphaerae bacterium]|nr:sigma-70 family RNA polymerase sigma factor [Phycisphaerae bacterium]
MATWRDDKILELATQLSYSPAEKRHEQLDAAIALVPTLDPDKTYPWDFVHFRITGFQPRAHTDHTVPGKTLLADLSTLIEFLSDTLSIKVEDATPHNADSVLSMEEVSRKFSVSSKTIQRWRKQGLIALRYIYPDGRRRLGFLEARVSQFAQDNKERVERSATFKQLSDDEKKQIIELARRFVPHGSLTDIAQRIAQRLNRSAEAVRYTIRQYDIEHPEAAVFPDEGAGDPRRTDRHAIVESFDNGTPIEQIAQHHALPPTSVTRIVTEEHAAKLKSVQIVFVANPLFEHPDADNIILTVLPAEALSKAQASVAAGTNSKASDVLMARMPRDLPAFLANIFLQPIMPQELETDAFRRMNYLKFRAAKLQSALDVAAEGAAAQVSEIESLLTQANELKNQLVQANLRVAVHVARKHERSNRPLIELFSDATLWLMRAADNFDFARGGSEHHARFSTYASYTIMKNFARDRADRLAGPEARVLTGQEELLNEVGARENAAEPHEAAASNAELLTVLKELPQRDQELLTHHYGLDTGKGESEPLSLSQIGDKMGITKARVRQLEVRALRKLRQLLETRREQLHNATSKST